MGLNIGTGKIILMNQIFMEPEKHASPLEKMEDGRMRYGYKNIHLSVIMVSTEQDIFFFDKDHFKIYYADRFTCGFTQSLTTGTQLEPEFVLVDEAMDWGSAQACCSQNFTSLVTVKNDIENQMVQSLVPSGDRAWIGLSRPNWFFWSDQSRFNFGYFDNVANPIDSMKVMCGVLALKSSGKFRFSSCETSLPFVCYNFPPPGEFPYLQWKRLHYIGETHV